MNPKNIHNVDTNSLKAVSILYELTDEFCNKLFILCVNLFKCLPWFVYIAMLKYSRNVRISAIHFTKLKIGEYDIFIALFVQSILGHDYTLKQKQLVNDMITLVLKSNLHSLINSLIMLNLLP